MASIVLFIIYNRKPGSCSSRMTTLIPQRLTPIDTNSPPKNILSGKPNNQAPTSKPTLAGEKQQTPQLRRSIQKPEVEGGNLLIRKQATRGETDQQNHLRKIIQTHEEEYRESKPFQKKYGTHNAAQFKPTHQDKPSSQQDNQKEAKDIRMAEIKNKTKESFNKKLNSNIIKDEEAPNSKHSYRIKKVDNRSPKKIRDDLILLNEEEHRIQMEILELHKSTKGQLEQYKQTYQFVLQNPKKHFPELQVEETTIEHYIELVSEKLKQKKNELNKVEEKMNSNPYLIYLNNLPEDIMELHSSEQEDEVPELPDNKPRLESNQGSYASAMRTFKDKKHALNLRRTYDVFKDDDRLSRVTTNHQEPLQITQEKPIKDQGENKVTVNNRLKDFLLS